MDRYRSSQGIRTIFQSAFEAAGLPYFNPHSFRNTLVQLGQTLCRDAEQFKAWSQNKPEATSNQRNGKSGKDPAAREAPRKALAKPGRAPRGSGAQPTSRHNPGVTGFRSRLRHAERRGPACT